MHCIVCDGPLCGQAVHLDQYTCTGHLVHEECMERWGNSWRNPKGGPKRTGFECPLCGGTSPNYLRAAGGSLENSNLTWVPYSCETCDNNGTDASATPTLPPLPPNAVTAGKERGMDVFVVRGRIRGDLIPGKLIPARGTAFFPWGGHEHCSQKCEVLTFQKDVEDCGTNSGMTGKQGGLKWISSSHGVIPPNAVFGGWTSYGETLYIGRTVFGEEKDVICGKVHPSHKVLYLPYSGKEFNKSQYEILVYEAKQPNPNPSSDSTSDSNSNTSSNSKTS